MTKPAPEPKISKGKRTPPKAKGMSPAQAMKSFMKHTPKVNKALR